MIIHSHPCLYLPYIVRQVNGCKRNETITQLQTGNTLLHTKHFGTEIAIMSHVSVGYRNVWNDVDIPYTEDGLYYICLIGYP